MSRVGSTREWYRFLDAHTADDAAGDLQKLIWRLDNIFANINYLAKLLAGSPGGEVEEALIVSRRCVDEAIGFLDDVITQMRRGDPDTAA
jgi:hypothetical protein